MERAGIRIREFVDLSVEPPELKCREKINKTWNRISSNHCGTITNGITRIMGLHKAKKEKRNRGSI